MWSLARYCSSRCCGTACCEASSSTVAAAAATGARHLSSSAGAGRGSNRAGSPRAPKKSDGGGRDDKEPSLLDALKAAGQLELSDGRFEDPVDSEAASTGATQKPARGGAGRGRALDRALFDAMSRTVATGPSEVAPPAERGRGRGRGRPISDGREAPRALREVLPVEVEGDASAGAAGSALRRRAAGRGTSLGDAFTAFRMREAIDADADELASRFGGGKGGGKGGGRGGGKGRSRYGDALEAAGDADEGASRGGRGGGGGRGYGFGRGGEEGGRGGSGGRGGFVGKGGGRGGRSGKGFGEGAQYGGGGKGKGGGYEEDEAAKAPVSLGRGVWGVTSDQKNYGDT